jgi:superfamily II DNA helicase RecQ
MDGDLLIQGPQVLDAPALMEQAVPLIRTLGPAQLSKLFQDIIPSQLRPPVFFLDSLDDKQRHTVFLACVLVFVLSLGKVVPRVFQLEAVLGALSGRDGIIASGTGSGKTLVMIILLLLCPTELCVLIVPLKRLQQAQLEAFNSYAIKTVVVNEDTSDDPVLWNVRFIPLNKIITCLEVLTIQDIGSGIYPNIITTMEQLGIFDGHMTRFGKLLRARDRKFITSIKRLEIDELHTVYTAGIPKHGQPAFRPAYGRFDVIRLLFPKTTTVLGFSATLPPLHSTGS